MNIYLETIFTFHAQLRETLSDEDFNRLNQCQQEFDRLIDQQDVPWFDDWIKSYSESCEELDVYIRAQRTAAINLKMMGSNAKLVSTAEEITDILQKVVSSEIFDEYDDAIDEYTLDLSSDDDFLLEHLFGEKSDE